MSYETRLFIAREYPDYLQDGGPIECRTLATIDLASAGYHTATGLLLQQARAAGERFYMVGVTLPTDLESSPAGMDSRCTLEVDKYGDRLTAVPYRALLDALRTDQRTDPYRGFAWAIALLEAVMATREESETIRVIQYGY